MSDKIELFNDKNESRGFYSKKNRLNELTGKEWVYWSKSVINQLYPPNLQHKLRSQHGGQKPPDLCADLIKVFTKTNQVVLDPFAGVGGTLIGASLSQRRCIGIEIDSNYIKIYKKVCKLEKIDEQRMMSGDSNKVLVDLKNENILVDFILTDVPYWNMDKVDRSKGKFKKVGEKQKERRKTKLKAFNGIKYPGKTDWLNNLKKIFEKAIALLKKNCYLAVFIGDMYNNKEYHFLSADLAGLLKELNLTMKANLVWYDVSKSLHVYGYLYQFIPSMIHQNILIFRKEF